METSLAGQMYALGATMLRTAGLAAVRRGLPLYFAVLVGAVVVFYGRYAMKASELVGLAGFSPGFRAVFLTAWFILALPVARAWVNSPSARFVRVFPVPWPAAALVLSLGLILLQLPWIILWSAGGGAVFGIWAALLAASAHALALGRPHGIYEWITVALWVGALMIGPGPALALALPALLGGARRAWIEGWEARIPGGRPWVSRSTPALAIGIAQLASLARRNGILFGRWAWLAALGVGVAVLAIRNNRLADPTQVDVVSLVVLVPVSIGNLLAVGAAAVRLERRALWLFEVMGTPADSRLRGTALALAACGLVFGLAHGTLVCFLVEGPPRVWAVATSTGAALGVVAALTVRWADRGSGRDAGRYISAGLLLSTIIISAGAWLGELGIALAVLAAGAVVASIPARRSARSIIARSAEDQD